MPLPFCVYILKSEKDGLNYIGFTSNLEKRIKDHNKGRTHSTSKRIPLRLIYCEFHQSKIDAMRRERYLKSNPGKRMIKYVLRDILTKSKMNRMA